MSGRKLETNVVARKFVPARVKPVKMGADTLIAFRPAGEAEEGDRRRILIRRTGTGEEEAITFEQYIAFVGELNDQAYKISGILAREE